MVFLQLLLFVIVARKIAVERSRCSYVTDPEAAQFGNKTDPKSEEFV
jgi:hypothetical protein